MTTDGFTIEGARKELDEFEKNLEQFAPNPINNRLLSLDHEYTMIELRGLLQHFGSYLATLTVIQGRIEAECQIIHKGLKTGLDIASLNPEIKANTITGKEAEIMASNENFAALKRLEIRIEARLAIIKGWTKAYEWAYTAASRIFSVDSVEASLVTNRVP